VNEDAWASEIAHLEELAAGAAGDMAFPLLAEVHRRAGRPEAAERVARAGLARSPGVSAGRVALALALLDQKRPEEARAELERLLGSPSEHALAGRAGARHAPEAERPSAMPMRGALSTLDPYEAVAWGAREAVARGHESVAEDAAERRAPPVFGGEVADGELDSAFEAARPEREQMVGADDVAHAALASLSLEDEPPDAAPSDVPLELAEAGAGAVAQPGSPFATETVAGLLERQGHRDEAERIRSALAPPAADAAAHGESESARRAEPEARDATPARAGRGRQATLERWLDNLRRDRG
jgi:hypothetical protein